MKKYWKLAVVASGAILGYAYYYFIGCRSGVCPITSNPWISSAYGALIGFLLTFGSRRKRETVEEKQSE